MCVCVCVCVLFCFVLPKVAKINGKIYIKLKFNLWSSMLYNFIVLTNDFNGLYEAFCKDLSEFLK